MTSPGSAEGENCALTALVSTQQRREFTMSAHPESEPLNQHFAECMRLHKCWAWFVFFGIVLIGTGAFAVVYATIFTPITVLLFGWLLVGGGVVEIVNAFMAGSWRGVFHHLLSGILHLVVGGVMIDRPERAAEILTLVLAVGFMIGGIIRLVGALADHFAGWAWVALSGVVTLGLGVAIWRQWPESAYWVIGLFAGIDLIFSGWSWVMLGLLVKGAGRAAQAVAPSKQAMEHVMPAR
jgi:uncharacterized membrane protein HdeD (DUF308 family)